MQLDHVFVQGFDYTTLFLREGNWMMAPTLSGNASSEMKSEQSRVEPYYAVEKWLY